MHDAFDELIKTYKTMKKVRESVESMTAVKDQLDRDCIMLLRRIRREAIIMLKVIKENFGLGGGRGADKNGEGSGKNNAKAEQ